MIPILECNITPFDTKNTEDAVEKNKTKQKNSVSLLLVIPNNERKTIVHQHISHNNVICTKTAVCI